MYSRNCKTLINRFFHYIKNFIKIHGSTVMHLTIFFSALNDFPVNKGTCINYYIRLTNNFFSFYSNQIRISRSSTQRSRP